MISSLLITQGILIFNTYYFSPICTIYLIINISTIVSYFIYLLIHMALFSNDNWTLSSSFISSLMIPLFAFFWMSSMIHTSCINLLNLGLLISHVGFYKQMVFYFIIILFISYVFIYWKMRSSNSLRYKFLSMFLRKNNKKENLENETFSANNTLGSSNDNNPKKIDNKLLQTAFLDHKYKIGISLLTKTESSQNNKINTENDTKNSINECQDSNSHKFVRIVKTREDVFFHFYLALNCLFFGKLLTNWIQLDMFGYLVENNINLWINLVVIVLFVLFIMIQLFLIKKYQTKFV